MAQEYRRAPRTEFWRPGGLFPAPVSLAIALGPGIGITTALWAFLNNQTDFVSDILFYAGATAFIYFIALGLDPVAIRRGWANRTYAPAVLGATPEGGRHILLAAAGGTIALILFAQLPSLRFGQPTYAFIADRAYSTTFLIPLLEETLFAGALWSLLYMMGWRLNLSRNAAFMLATLGTAIAFTAYHSQVYRNDGDFVFAYLFMFRVVISVANWYPVLRGYPPGIFPGSLIHMALNTQAYYSDCVAGLSQAHYC